MATVGYSRHTIEAVRRRVGDLDKQVFPHDRDITRLLRTNGGDEKSAAIQGIEEYLTRLMTGKTFAAGASIADRAALLKEAREVYKLLTGRWDDQATSAQEEEAGVQSIQATPIYYPNLGVGSWRR